MNNEKKFPFYLRRSFYIHCALASLGLLGGKIVLTQQQKLQDQNLELIRASVRVDMVAMPEQTLEELKTMTADTPASEVKKEEIKVEPKAEVQEVTKTDTKEIEKPDVNSAEDRHQSFLMKMKHLSGRKISKPSSTSKVSETQELKQLVLAGNRLSKGTETYGNSQGADQTAFQVYVSRLPQKVKPYWRLPSFLLDKKLKCRVRVWIAMNGMVARAEIYQSSGDRDYDQKALDAVNSASPFPQLSDDFGKRALNGEILLGFPL
jgi:TonB family protein